ncbi:rap1 GTPase-GDP dissociation stimulator 1-B-like protein [Dinothrombium tinctorium]|uniref:Rap1 GTPase-GDP dissociation stimulator 1-B-like protein n=1 Tax=Dinothrombium tinctorium TaxID=1965070 RepID=A0A3S3QRU2_9ACAR|nr:rap1 GTPase-GDP dissociation stimulator 1-B-like protein [Dinothrombium tinctorium]RWS12997.1 rap1 GTPase-GDP dissociation stimulator 1-B-like protein [Dinothrombium tinctorium]RWS13003.1 rap1 GTPase-GDP dissociation stimulator 1-B-like protein [Dinothrombium tinctorium]
MVLSLCNDIVKELNKECERSETHIESIVDSGFVHLLIDLLATRETLTDDGKKIVCEVIAELAKFESARIPCSDDAIIQPLITMLKENDRRVVLHSCRAIGNICYENDIARVKFAERKGLRELLALMDRLATLNNETERINARLLAVISGCLLNATNSNEIALQIALSEGLISILLKYFKRFSSVDPDIALHCLLLMHCLIDSDCGRSEITKLDVLKQIISILDENTGESTVEALVELFTSLCEDESAKVTMTKLGLPQKLIKMSKKNDFDESIRKIILDFVTLILTEGFAFFSRDLVIFSNKKLFSFLDTSMNLLYDNGNGEVYKQCSAWMDSKNQSLLKFSVLALANFARSDENCINMVKDGIHLKLIHITKQNSTIDGDLRLQHACLSALRNLSIPIANKPRLCESGLIELLLQMSHEVKAYPVVFKLLGTLRMLIDKQETVARRVANDELFLNKLIEFCAIEEHVGVKGESVRLLASLIKNSKDPNAMNLITSLNGIPVIVEMINCEHKIMQNEALIALTLIITISEIPQLESFLIQARFPNAIHRYLTDFIQGNGVCALEIFSNILTTIEMAVIRFQSLKECLKNEQVLEDLKEALRVLELNNDEIKAKIGKMIQILNS